LTFVFDDGKITLIKQMTEVLQMENKNVIEYNGKVFEVKLNFGTSLRVRRLNKDFSLNQRKRYCEFVPTNSVKWLSGNIENVEVYQRLVIE
jgi:hypothetical protein